MEETKYARVERRKVVIEVEFATRGGRSGRRDDEDFDRRADRWFRKRMTRDGRQR